MNEILRLLIEEQETVLQLKQKVLRDLGVPVEHQRLVYKGKTLVDDKTMNDCAMIPGSKIFLMVKKQDESSSASKSSASPRDFWATLNIFLSKHFRAEDAPRITEAFRQEYETNMATLSLDDIERIASYSQMKSAH
ncbi:hypothetical protein CAPTEDRAFT_206761 [Capitella teleta]|uniref:Ubiquitin-like domain-containing protein n=1 Tax=Capitella teleta TaxID=283909 RepID=R7UCC1_CAPTE|nr:hypothetical protein CAPTEDRAFT_206761 [Capitella teleta]|eukprot:ELU01413.1 hypothetical protein CAPTEDRAFT_206761 [Capitella teleta]